MTSPVGRPVCWQRSPGLIGWPRDWQRPARTEEWVYEQCTARLGNCRLSELICFPWATLVDLLDRGQVDRARPFTAALSIAPPRAHLIRATVCQHIRIDPLLPWMQRLQITDLFWSHARTEQRERDGIRLHPFPLYPVRALDGTAAAAGSGRLPAQRRYLYSFIGAYSASGYLTPARQWIVNLPRRDDALVRQRGAWHYESMVYGEQVGQCATPPDLLARLASDGEEFDAVLLDSTFSLCPSGSGPNSIRLWESLGFGCIPVLISDTLRLPGTSREWDEAILRVPETREAVAALPARLEELSRDPARLERMQEAGRRLWVRYGEQGPATVLGVLAETTWVRSQLPVHRPTRLTS